MAVNTSNVAAGKPTIGGAISVAAKGTTLPTDAVTALSSAFKGLGYVSEDGLTNQNTATVEQIKAWGGDVVLTPSTEKTDYFIFTLIEILNVDVLKFVYGANAVTGDLTTGITLAASSQEADECVLVIDMVLNGALKRIVLPKAKVNSIDDIVYQDGSPVGYPCTVTALPDENGITHYEYIINDPSGPSF